MTAKHYTLPPPLGTNRNSPNLNGGGTILIRGHSMWPTLRNMEHAAIRPYGDRRIRPGDVVLIRPPGVDHTVTHRVKRITSFGITTKGDNCENEDRWVIPAGDVLGRLTWVARHGRKRRVRGGILGRLWSAGVQILPYVDTVAASLFPQDRPRQDYHKFITALCTRMLHIKVITFQREEGPELLLLWGRRVIGRLDPGKTRWAIRRPFRLFVDESLLPGHDTTQISES
jgi:hypothetical protein